MTGLPSIVAGLFILALWVIALGRGFSRFAGSLALAVLMLPTIVRSAEEVLRLVPRDLREASYALGINHRVTVLRIVVPTALSGIVTGILLAFARVVGETAPLLLTVFGNTVSADRRANDHLATHERTPRTDRTLRQIQTLTGSRVLLAATLSFARGLPSGPR